VGAAHLICLLLRAERDSSSGATAIRRNSRKLSSHGSQNKHVTKARAQPILTQIHTKRARAMWKEIVPKTRKNRDGKSTHQNKREREREREMRTDFMTSSATFFYRFSLSQ